ncbi:unnamed protein product, partial [Symbiodinium microadriaticum]
MPDTIHKTRADAGFAGDGHVPTVPPDFLTPNLALFQDAAGLSTNAEAYYQSEEALEDPASGPEMWAALLDEEPELEKPGFEPSSGFEEVGVLHPEGGLYAAVLVSKIASVVRRRWRRLEDRDEALRVLYTLAPSPIPGSYDLSLHLARDEANRKAREALAAVGRASRSLFANSGQGGPPPVAERKPRLRPWLLAGEEISAAEQSVYDAVADGPHDKAAKPRRAARFAAWLVQTYGKENDDDVGDDDGDSFEYLSGSGVLDVAGGVEMEVPSTLVDPALRRGGALKSWQRRALRKRGREEAFAHLPVMFEASHFGPEAPGSQAALLANASLVAGLHPDEATEAIVDLALDAGRRFAVVPCCVFAEKFPSRELAPGVPVRTLNQFCAGYFNELSSEDPNRIFLARRINKLGFRAQENTLSRFTDQQTHLTPDSAEELWLHYSKYGPVEKVLVANAKAEFLHSPEFPLVHARLQLMKASINVFAAASLSLQFRVMETAATVKEIMALGE